MISTSGTCYSEHTANHPLLESLAAQLPPEGVEYRRTQHLQQPLGSSHTLHTHQHTHQHTTLHTAHAIWHHMCRTASHTHPPLHASHCMHYPRRRQAGRMTPPSLTGRSLRRLAAPELARTARCAATIGAVSPQAPAGNLGGAGVGRRG